MNRFVELNYRDLLPNFPGDRFERGKIINKSMHLRNHEPRNHSLTSNNFKNLSNTLTNIHQFQSTKQNKPYTSMYNMKLNQTGKINISNELNRTLGAKGFKFKLKNSKRNFKLFKSTFNLPQPNEPYRFSQFSPTLITNR